jgi:hypothetical protein
VKKLFFVLQFGLFIAFNFFLLMTGFQLISSDASVTLRSYNTPVYNLQEEFDPNLQRFNTMDKLVGYCDSLYMEKTYSGANTNYESEYPDLVSSVIKKRFYHGYSVYGFSNNYVAIMLERVSINGLSAIVIPDDILKYPYAACSQQSIVMMEVLKQKGFTTRKVGFTGKKYGHFSFETYYNGAWHFYDPNMEPDNAVLAAYNKPGIAFLANHPDLLLKAYKHVPKEKVMDLFPNYQYGATNTFSAPRAIIFHKITKFLSYTIWSFFLLAFLWARRKYKKLGQQYVGNKTFYVPRIQQGSSPVQYPNYSSQGA